MQRAYQIYLIGADYTVEGNYQQAIPANEYNKALRGKYRCDTFVLDVLHASRKDFISNGYIKIPSREMEFWRHRVETLHYDAKVPRIIFDKLKTFQ